MSTEVMFLKHSRPKTSKVWFNVKQEKQVLWVFLNSAGKSSLINFSLDFCGWYTPWLMIKGMLN